MHKLFFLSIVALLLFTGTDCKDKPPVVPPENKPDTTSHNFTFTTYTFGGNAGSSYFKDVAIINDTDIWAVGQIYTSPETTYNAAHWNGKEWELKKISVIYNGNKITPNLEGIFTFSSTDIWVSSGVPAHYDGNTWTQYHLFDMGILSQTDGAVNKIWGTSSTNLYIVGNAGTIVHYNGSTWSKQESGTTIDLRDVWGSADGKTVWACGESNNGFASILLKYENNQWKTIWERNGPNSIEPYGYNVGSVWSKKQAIYITSSNGVFQIKDTISLKMKDNFSEYSRSLRGNEEYDMLTCGEGGRMWHYNGVDWKKLLENSNYFLMGANIKNNIAIAVGTDYGIGFGAGLIYVGRRN